MGVGREGADDLDVGIGGGVGLIHDAERGFTARHQQERGAHVLGRRDLGGDRRPHAERLERGLAVLAGRHAGGIDDDRGGVRPHLGRKRIGVRFECQQRSVAPGDLELVSLAGHRAGTVRGR